MARILIAGPHPDDQELGMGATIARLAQLGHDVLLLDITNGEPTPHGTPELRAQEAEAARLALCPDTTQHPQGRPVRRMLLGLPNRSVQHTLEARHRVASVIRAHQAQIVFTPYFEDAHPDHLAVTRIVEDARFDAKLTSIELPPVPNYTDSYTDGLSEAPPTLGPPIYPRWLIYYYATHLRIVPNPSFIFDATQGREAKRAAVLAYTSQFVTNKKNQGVVEWLDAAGIFFGSRIGAAYGEPFFCREPLRLGDLGGLLE
jgi:N-acetylglucosamine malate deacetylase 1